jgi:hypothetical protein
MYYGVRKGLGRLVFSSPQIDGFESTARGETRSLAINAGDRAVSGEGKKGFEQRHSGVLNLGAVIRFTYIRNTST